MRSACPFFRIRRTEVLREVGIGGGTLCICACVLNSPFGFYFVYTRDEFYDVEVKIQRPHVSFGLSSGTNSKLLGPSRCIRDSGNTRVFSLTIHLHLSRDHSQRESKYESRLQQRKRLVTEKVRRGIYSYRVKQNLVRVVVFTERLGVKEIWKKRS